ncbi:MAG: HlyC/CorC family transporter [Chloroflexi bacterium HGW-Chloroflexi-3]|nr:MAG: HlyC/CorC family transporter [Chloroflexi bacterium HGW-Chloroflexi-3]
MNNYLWILFFVILGLDLLFSIVRSSLLNSRPMQLIGMREMDPKGVELALSVLDKKRLRVSLRISMILMHFIISAFIYFIFISLFPQMAIWLVFGMVILAAFLLLLVEFALEGLVLHAPEKWAIRIAWLGDVMRFVFAPLAALMMAVLGSSENLQQRLGPVTEEEIRTWVNTDQGDSGLEKDEREMIYSIFQFGETLCREVMVPRIDITGLEVNATVQEAIDIFTKSGHSRVPVYEETIDEIIGLLYAKDLLRTDLTEKEKTEVRPFLRKAYFIPESKNVDELLREMQAQGVHMAIVVDEYGGTAGLVTLEDIVEEIVGEIRDEYDQAEELEFQQMSEDEVVFSGRIDLDDVYDILGVDLTEDMADTLGGYIYGQIGRVPVGGEQIKVDGWLLTVSQVSGRRIRKVLAKRVDHISETEQSDAD